MRNTILLCLFAFVVSCTPQPVKITSKFFNENAKNAFLRDFASYDLDPLTKQHQCVLYETITNDLNALDNMKTIVVDDNFYVKNYLEGYIDLNFSFIFNETTKQFHFISLPFLNDFIMNVPKYYTPKNDSVYVLKKSVSFMKIDSPFIDRFFESEEFRVEANNRISFAKKWSLARAILLEVFGSVSPRLTKEASIFGVIEDKLSAGLIAESEYRDIKKLLRRMSTESNYSVEDFFINGVGHVLFVYSLNADSSKIAVDCYLLPEHERRMIYRHGVTEYRHCFAK